MNQSLPKRERISKKKKIEELFQGGKSFKSFPVRIIYTFSSQPDPVPVQVLFSVPKKKIKKPVTRNLLKRRMKEAYRLNKHLIAGSLPPDKSLLIGIIYSSTETGSFSQIQSKIIYSLNRLKKTINSID